MYMYSYEFINILHVNTKAICRIPFVESSQQTLDFRAEELWHPQLSSAEKKT